MSSTRPSPSYHLPEEILADYVRGTGGEAEALISACHLTLCGQCQSRASALESAAAAQLDGDAPEAGDGSVDAGLEAVLGRLDDLAPIVPAPRAPHPELNAGLPRPLLDYLPEGKLPWRRVVPGIRAMDLPVNETGATRVRLVRLHPGVVIPHHDHGGPEYIVVFSGGLRDADGTAHRGDVAVRRPGDSHRQHVEPGEECVALVVNDGDLLPTTWIGRLFKRIAGE